MKIMLICAKEMEYAKRLAEYIAGQRSYMIRVHYCDDIKKVEELSGGLRIEYLLIDSAFTPEQRADISAGRRFVLTKHPEERVGEGEIALFQYQSAEEIMRRILECCVDDPHLMVRREHKKNMKIISFYSPIGRLGQTSLALNLGRELAEKDSVLYLNLTPYARGGHFPEGEAGDLEEMIYFLRQEAPNLTLRLKSMTGQMGGMDYLAPFKLSTDLYEIGEEEWTGFLDLLESEGSYGLLILDLQDGLAGLKNILKKSAHIFMPVLSDSFSQLKEEAFRRELRELGEDELVPLIRKLPMEEEPRRLIASCRKAILLGSTDCGPL